MAHEKMNQDYQELWDKYVELSHEKRGVENLKETVKRLRVALEKERERNYYNRSAQREAWTKVYKNGHIWYLTERVADLQDELAEKDAVISVLQERLKSPKAGRYGHQNPEDRRTAPPNLG